MVNVEEEELVEPLHPENYSKIDDGCADTITWLDGLAYIITCPPCGTVPSPPEYRYEMLPAEEECSVKEARKLAVSLIGDKMLIEVAGKAQCKSPVHCQSIDRTSSQG